MHIIIFVNGQFNAQGVYVFSGVLPDRRGRKRSAVMGFAHIAPFCSPGSGAKRISWAVIVPR